MRALVMWCTALAALAACRAAVDPDQGRFSCAEAKDCGGGFECRAQAAGGGRCFKAGACADVERCNGADDDCDGLIDEAFPEQGGACASGGAGECAAGTTACVAGALVCAPGRGPAAETCNGKDDDCDGMVDEAFDLMADEAHCGGCGRACDAGTSCLSGACLETACDDGLDNDLNARADCDDEACFGQPCVTPAPPTRRCGAVPAGLDGGADAGLARGCFAPEADCANGVDDDGDGLVDCGDLDCNGRTCFSGTTCASLVCPGPG
jgi:hypothetical protein